MFPFDQSNQAMYQQYAQAHDSGNVSNLDHQQLLGDVTQFMQNAPGGMQMGVLQQLFSSMAPQQRQTIAQQVPGQYNMNPNDPTQMAQGLQQLGQAQPGLLGQLFGPGSPLGSPMAKMALASIAGLAAKQMMQPQQSRS
jgi:hypothetical protein